MSQGHNIILKLLIWTNTNYPKLIFTNGEMFTFQVLCTENKFNNHMSSRKALNFVSNDSRGFY